MEGTTLKIVGNFEEKGYLYAIIDEGTAEIDLNRRAEEMNARTPVEKTQSLEIDEERQQELDLTRRVLQYIYDTEELVQPLNIANGEMAKRTILQKSKKGSHYTATIEFFQLKPYYVYRWWAIGTSNNPAIQYADLTSIEEGFIKIE